MSDIVLNKIERYPQKDNLVSRLGQFRMINPIMPQIINSSDQGVWDFLETDAWKFLEKIGTEEIYYSSDDDFFLKGLHQQYPETKDPKHLVYYIKSAEFYISPERFSFSIWGGLVPILAINEDSTCDLMRITCFGHQFHQWNGPGQDKLLFNSLKEIVNYSNDCQKISLQTENGSINFYKKNHKLGQTMNKYLGTSSSQK